MHVLKMNFGLLKVFEITNKKRKSLEINGMPPTASPMGPPM